MSYSYLNNITFEEAIDNFSNEILKTKILKVEKIKTENALNRITANEVFANISSPNYNASAMDGIAVKASDTFNATETTPVILSEQQFCIIDTGDPVPNGFDAVVMIENVVFENGKAVLQGSAPVFSHIRQIGEDMCKGDMILPSFTKITPEKIGALLAGGVNEINVFKKLRVGIIPTGDELISCDREPFEGEILEYNSKIFKASLMQMECDVKIYDIVKDKKNLIIDALTKATSENDIVIINAGSSAGRDDYTKKAIESIGNVFCHGIAIKPGKPTILGMIDNTPVIGIPGYPVSAVLVLKYIVESLIEKIYKNNFKPKKYITATLARKINSDLKYKEFIRLKIGFTDNKYVAVPLAKGAGVISSLSNADAIYHLPLNSEGVEAGESITVELLRDEDEIKRTLIINGSHDPLIDLIGNILRKNTNYFLSSANTGSMGGIMAILRGEAHIAPIHLLDTKNGEYNKSYIEKYLKDDIVLIKGVKRTQGIIVKRGNPKNITCISDIAKQSITFVNRQKGAGTRILLDFLLKKSNIEKEKIYGYQNEEFTHAAVAAQISKGNADVGIGIQSAANLYGLDFIPLAQEEYDFIIKKDSLQDEYIKEFLKALKSEELEKELKQLGGYEINNER